MSDARMHVEEIATDASLVHRLLAAQFPAWAGLSIVPVPSAGTDHALYRLGDDMVARLPRIHWAVGQAEMEILWLPRLAPFLPLAIPQPLAQGEPGEGYPYTWSIHRWIDGECATTARITDELQAARDLARFITALQRVETSPGALSRPPGSPRGEPLAMRDARTRDAITALRGSLDPTTVTAAWEASFAAPEWSGPPVWIHGDLLPGNVLVQEGRLNAVIDFGCVGLGDPAVDVMAAWTFLSAESRPEFRAALAVDDATWARARGWALSVGLIALPYYQDTNPTLAGVAQRAINEALADAPSPRGRSASRTRTAPD